MLEMILTSRSKTHEHFVGVFVVDHAEFLPVGTFRAEIKFVIIKKCERSKQKTYQR